MKIIITRDYQEMSVRAAQLVIDLIKQKPDAVLGLATGRTPIGFYQELVKAYLRREISFAKVKTFNLDEYVGVNRSSRDSFWTYMQTQLFSQVDIRQENINMLDGTASNLQDECINYERLIEDAGGIDLQLLGIGLDGHIGFCEPGTAVDKRTFVVDLTELTMQSNQETFTELKKSPSQGLTMGPATIMEARKILLIANGKNKRAIVKKALYGSVTTKVPASILQRHLDCTCVLDALASGE